MSPHHREPAAAEPRGETRLTQPRREPTAARLLTAVRLVFAALGIAGLVFGYFGLKQYLRPPSPSGTRASISNLIYYDIELALLQSTPLANGGTVNTALQVGRFCAPCVLVYPITEFVVALSATRVRRRRTRRARGHAVVCGSTRAAQTLTARLRANGTRVVVISTASVDEPERDVVVGDPRMPQTLLAAGVSRADRVYACLERGEENAAIAAAVEQLRTPQGPHRIHVFIPDADLCSALRARRWSLATPGAHRLNFVNPDELAAQAVVRADEAAFAGETPRIAIVGTGAFARAVLVEFARQWVSRGGARREPVCITLIGTDADDVAAALSARFAFLSTACRIRAHREPFAGVLEHCCGASTNPLRRLYLCQQDETEALKSALDTAARLPKAATRIVARIDRMTGIAAGFRTEPGGGSALFDALGGRLRLVDVIEEGCDPIRMEDDLAEWLARACHQRYLADQFALGAAPADSPALVPWERLAEQYRAANRDQAADVGRKLAAIGCVLCLRQAGGPDFEFRNGELDRLAELEHERWTAERLRRGWRLGPLRDEARQVHPALLAWADLPEPQREKDRQVVRGLPSMLADAGLAIARAEPEETEPAGSPPSGDGPPAPGPALTQPRPHTPLSADATSVSGAADELNRAAAPQPARSP